MYTHTHAHVHTYRQTHMYSQTTFTQHTERRLQSPLPAPSACLSVRGLPCGHCHEVLALHSPGSLKANSLDRLLLLVPWLQLPAFLKAKQCGLFLCVSARPSLR